MNLHRRFVRGDGLRIDPERLSLLFLLAALLMLLLAAAPGAQAQGRCRAYTGGWSIRPRCRADTFAAIYNFFNRQQLYTTRRGDWWTSTSVSTALVDDWDRDAAIRSCIRHTGYRKYACKPQRRLILVMQAN